MAGHSASSRQRPGHPRPLGAGEGRRGRPGAKMLLARFRAWRLESI